MHLRMIERLVGSILLAQRQRDETEEHFRAGAEENPHTARTYDHGAKFVYHLAYAWVYP